MVLFPDSCSWSRSGNHNPFLRQCNPPLVRTPESSKYFHVDWLQDDDLSEIQGSHRPTWIGPSHPNREATEGLASSAVSRPLVTGQCEVSEGLWRQEGWWKSSGHEAER